MGDELIERLKQSEKVLKELSNEQIIYLALSEILQEIAVSPAYGVEIPVGLKVRRISLSADLTRRAGVKW